MVSSVNSVVASSIYGGTLPAGGGNWAEAEHQARDVGIAWQRPKNDRRTAREIIDSSPLLKNLGNQSGVKDMLKKRVGDFEKDADAAYRATQVLEHVEKLDGEGGRIVGRDVDNGQINGFTKSGEARHGTEAGRLQDFGKHGFSNLKGVLQNASTVADDRTAREQAEAAGIVWKLPQGDGRTAREIIDDSPLLKNLGNQSHVKDMLKERVGDFENDADAAFRASQVLDRVTISDGKGGTLSGDGVLNTSIDGFTKSGEARHDTEAGRLQDFGKYGFSALPGLKKTDDIGSYKNFLKSNPDADAASQKIAKYGAVLGENYDLIRGKTGSGGALKAEDLNKFLKENPQVSGDFKEALKFWSQPGALGVLDTAADPLKLKADGSFSKKDLESWLSSQAPKNSTSAMTFLAGIANGNVVSGTDTSKLNKDVFEHPDKYSKEQKAAVLQQLVTAQQLVMQGAKAGMWSDSYGQVSISNRSDTHPNPSEVLKDINAHIDVLQNDPEVMKYMNESSSTQMSALLNDNKGLKDAVRQAYDKDIKSGAIIDKLWSAKTKDKATDQQAVLAEFYTTATTFQQALGVSDPGEIQGAVKKSKHNGDFENFYKQSLASGERLKDLLKKNAFNEASSAFLAEVAVYNAVLDPDFTTKLDAQLNAKYSEIARDNVAKDGSFADLKKAFGVDGGDRLDEGKVRSLVDKISKDNPELLLNADGKVANADQILAAFRGAWDIGRQGAKSFAELKSEWLNPSLKDVADKGVLHGVSGLLMAGTTIAKGAQSGGNPTDRQIVDITTGSVQTATLLTEGGIKNFRDTLKTFSAKADPRIRASIVADSVKRMGDVASRFENAAKGLGGMAGIVAGAYGIFDGVQSIRKGDKVSGGIGITAGSLGAIAGLASAVEGGLGVIAPQVLKMLPIAGAAGVLGIAAAGVGAIAMVLPGLIVEGKRQTRVDNFGDLLGSYLKPYEIDGVPKGDVAGLPDSVWPKDNSVAS